MSIVKINDNKVGGDSPNYNHLFLVNLFFIIYYNIDTINNISKKG